MNWLWPFKTAGILWLVLWPLVASSSLGATIVEDFADDPRSHGWRSFGAESLFSWDQTNQNLQVTWDSAKPNSFFYRALGTVLSKSEDFRFAFEFSLSEIQVGVDADKPLTFELAVGLLNFLDSNGGAFVRGTGLQSPNLVEFDYFPDSGFGATISPTIVSSNNQFATSFSFPLELDLGALFAIEIDYAAQDQSLSTKVTRNHQPFGPIKEVKLEPTFSDFRVDTFAVSSYSDASADGSIFARGTVDNISIIFPSPPIGVVTGWFSGKAWLVSFETQIDWTYALEETLNLREWRTVSTTLLGSGTRQTLQSTNMPPSAAYYRVRAERL